MSYAPAVGTAADIPRGRHWAIVEDVRVTIPADQRSRTDPGHGYPERTETYQTYRAYADYENFRIEFLRLRGASRAVRGIEVQRTFGEMRVMLAEDPR